MAKSKKITVRLNCTYDNGAEAFRPGDLVEMDTAAAERLQKSGLVEIIPTIPEKSLKKNQKGGDETGGDGGDSGDDGGNGDSGKDSGDADNDDLGQE
jgi:hypothetical protein